MAALGLHCFQWAFSSCGKWGLLSTCGTSLLPRTTGSRALGLAAQWHVEDVAIFPDQGSNLCPLNWQANS